MRYFRSLFCGAWVGAVCSPAVAQSVSHAPVQNPPGLETSVVPTMPLRPLLFDPDDPQALPVPLISARAPEASRPGVFYRLHVQTGVRHGRQRGLRQPTRVLVEPQIVPLQRVVLEHDSAGKNKSLAPGPPGVQRGYRPVTP